MADRHVDFRPYQVRAALDGRLSQTRRVLRPQPDQPSPHSVIVDKTRITKSAPVAMFRWHSGLRQDVRLQFAIGDRLWVREAWNVFSFSEDGEEAWPCAKIPTADEYREVIEAAYRFDMQPIYQESDRARKWFSDQPWRPSIHMPRWASRLTLLVTDVRVQRLQEISADDAVAEGLVKMPLAPPLAQEMGCDWGFDGDTRHGSPISAFAALWNSIHGPEAWDANPWVCAISFTVHRGNIDAMTPTTQGDEPGRRE